MFTDELRGTSTTNCSLHAYFVILKRKEVSQYQGLTSFFFCGMVMKSSPTKFPSRLFFSPSVRVVSGINCSFSTPPSQEGIQWDRQEPESLDV